MEVIGQKDKGHLRGQRSNYKKCSDWAQIYMEWSFCFILYILKWNEGHRAKG